MAAEDLEELLALILPQTKDYAVIVTDPAGQVVGWLGGAEEVLGYTAAEMTGKPLSAIFTPEDTARGIPEFERDVAQHRSSAQDDRWHLRKDGTRIWVSGTLSVLRDESGVRGFVKIVRDRTDLRIAVDARANRIAAMEGTLEAMNDFLRTLGHELRNPLGAIKNVGYLLSHGDDERYRNFGDIIGNQLSVLERLAADLMDVSRLERGKVALRLEDADVSALLREEVAARAFEAAGMGVKLEAILPAYPVHARCDRTRLRQAVLNLIGNALKYTPAGGQVWVKAVDEDDDVVVRVQDTGIGIAPDVLPKIFELFTQEPRARELAPGGLGIGLAIVREIVALHGGLVQARSGGVGKGSEFTIRLPRRGRGDAAAA